MLVSYLAANLFRISELPWLQGLMEYKSSLYQMLETLVFLPTYLTSSSSQKQTVTVQLFNTFIDDPVSEKVQHKGPFICNCKCVAHRAAKYALVG